MAGMARVAIVLLAATVTIYAFIDCARTPAEAMPGKISKPLWLLLTAIAPLLGASIWLFFKYQKVLTSETPIGGKDLLQKLYRSGNKKTKGPLAPDDDPDFLARLEARNRRKAFEEKQRAQNKKTPTDSEQDEKDEESPSPSNQAQAEPNPHTESTEKTAEQKDEDDGKGLYGF